MNKKRGLLAVVSGFSGSGKSTVTKRLAEEYDGYVLSVSATTRLPRTGERDGVEYFFRTEEEFNCMIRENVFLEYAFYVNHGYGTPSAFVEQMREAGKDVLLEIDMQGAMKVREKCPDAVLVFITTPTAAELVRRLTGRGTEDPDVIRSRLRRAVEESAGMKFYDYILVNDNLDDCVEELHHLLKTCHKGSKFQTELIETMQRELAEQEELQV
ncbi:MAG: guanylate kinase [Eubacterium sp.]|nr:guanylate kinase [Eubacterium sp.]